MSGPGPGSAAASESGAPAGGGPESCCGGRAGRRGGPAPARGAGAAAVVGGAVAAGVGAGGVGGGTRVRGAGAGAGGPRGRWRRARAVAGASAGAVERRHHRRVDGQEVLQDLRRERLGDLMEGGGGGQRPPWPPLPAPLARALRRTFGPKPAQNGGTSRVPGAACQFSEVPRNRPPGALPIRIRWAAVRSDPTHPTHAVICGCAAGHGRATKGLAGPGNPGTDPPPPSSPSLDAPHVLVRFPCAVPRAHLRSRTHRRPRSFSRSTFPSPPHCPPALTPCPSLERYGQNALPPTPSPRCPGGPPGPRVPRPHFGKVHRVVSHDYSPPSAAARWPPNRPAAPSRPKWCALPPPLASSAPVGTLG